ncbi:MAG: T9SS type A sorting domain-containing protein [Flavobacteriales bacterium]|nr:T9SS type A sorting domain-containing protein [Flavobacteriales bacterium]
MTTLFPQQFHHMRNLVFLPFLLLCAGATAQWATSPATPLTVADAANDRRDIVAIEGDASDRHVLWIDNRQPGNITRIYGQHLNAQGESQWAPNGRMLLEHPKAVNQFTAVRTAADRIMVVRNTAFIQGQLVIDSLLVYLLDNEGTMVWNEPLGMTGGSGPAHAADQPVLMPTGDGGALLAWQYRAASTANMVVKLQKIAADGTLMHPITGLNVNGTGVPNTSYRYQRMVTDGAGGAYLVWSSMAPGEPVWAQRIGNNGQLLWPAPVEVVGSTNGLGDYLNGGWFQVADDDEGGLMVVWSNNTTGQFGDIFITRILADGSAAWSPAVRTVCSDASIQQFPHLDVLDGTVVVTWRDARLGAFRPFAQRMGVDGVFDWMADGVEVMGGLAANSQFPRVRVLADGGAFITGNGSGGFICQRMDPFGVPAWANPTVVATNQPSNSIDEVVLREDDDSHVLFWRSVQRIYGARVTPSGGLGIGTGIAEALGNVALQAWPVPANHELYVRLPEGERDLRFTLHGSDGRQVQGMTFTATADLLRMDVSGLAAGWYVLRAVGGSKAYQVRFVKQ